MPLTKLMIVIKKDDCSNKIPRRGWAEMIRKVYEVSPLVCPKCRGEMRIIAFITDFSTFFEYFSSPAYFFSKLTSFTLPIYTSYRCQGANLKQI
jgi:hypothetical protein